MKAIISQNIFKNWEKKDLWDHNYNLQLNPNKFNKQVLKIIIKEIKSR